MFFAFYAVFAGFFRRRHRYSGTYITSSTAAMRMGKPHRWLPSSDSNCERGIKIAQRGGEGSC